jgi:hypothetical protein
MAETGERIELLCRALDESNLRGYANRAGAGKILTRILAAVADGVYGPELDRDLDALDDALAQSGLGAVTDADRGKYRRVPGAGTAHPVVDVWVCPAARPCSRVEPAAGQSASPQCAATGQCLRLHRVAT